MHVGVLVLAATNRPHAIDTALLRPGRFDSLLYVNTPDKAGRLAILDIHSRAMPLAPDVDLAVRLNFSILPSHGWQVQENAFFAAIK